VQLRPDPGDQLAEHPGAFLTRGTSARRRAWISSFVSEDKTRTFCVYDAPAPEAIRKAAIGNELPIDQVTQVRVPSPHF
jgi:hypothetical protein